MLRGDGKQRWVDWIQDLTSSTISMICATVLLGKVVDTAFDG